MAENLVFQELQNELGGLVAREVSLSSMRLDGVVRTGAGDVLVEVKFVETAFALQHISRAWVSRVAPKWERLKLENQNIKSMTLVVVWDGDECNATYANALAAKVSRGTPFDIRAYCYKDLLRKYGMSDVILPPNTETDSEQT